jgi:hypothetical protein
LCNKVYQWLATGRWFSSTNRFDHHGVTEILLKEALNTITLTLIPLHYIPIQTNHSHHLGIDHLTWRGSGVMVFCFVQNFFSDNTRVWIFFFVAQIANFFFQNMTKTNNISVTPWGSNLLVEENHRPVASHW